MEHFGTTINVQLVAKRLGEYTVYIFKNLENSQFITVTKLPNWQDAPDINIGSQGFLTYIFVRADKDTWVNKLTGETISYKCSANYYQSFIPSSHVINNNIVTPRELLVR